MGSKFKPVSGTDSFRNLSSSDKKFIKHELNALDDTKQQHVASVHEEKKPFKCDSCDYSCNRKINLKQHIVSVHEAKRSFKCESCEYGCASKGNLKKHVASVHEGKKILTLNVCGLNRTGRIDQVQNLLLKYKVSIAVLNETEIIV